MRIAKLAPSQRKKGRWLVTLDNGDLLRVTENEVVSFSLYTDMELDETTLAALRTCAESARHKEYALNLLSARPLSRAELLKKLKTRECPDQEGEAIADRLTELGYLNDEQYAKTLVAHFSAKGYGPYKIKDELFRRGVPKEFWDGALDGRDESTHQLDALLAKRLRGNPSPDRQELKKASDALARRGFSWQEVSAALRRYGADVEEE